MHYTVYKCVQWWQYQTTNALPVGCKYTDEKHISQGQNNSVDTWEITCKKSYPRQSITRILTTKLKTTNGIHTKHK